MFDSNYLFLSATGVFPFGSTVYSVVSQYYQCAATILPETKSTYFKAAFSTFCIVVCSKALRLQSWLALISIQP